MTPTIEDLSREYDQSARLLEERLKDLRTALGTARGTAALDLQKRIDVLYLEMLDTRRTMGYLRSYYKS